MEPKTNEQLIKENEALLLENSTLKSENDVLVEVNKELTLEIENHKTEPAEALQPGFVSKETFEFKKEVYGFKMHGVNHNGTVITIADVLAKKDLQADLIKIKSGMIGIYD